MCTWISHADVGDGRRRSRCQAGVLIRSAEAIEAMEKVDPLVVDKTGTLTEGKPRLLRVLTARGLSQDEMLLAASSVEPSSEHPLSAAIVQGARERGVKPQPVAGFASFTGGGVIGKLINVKSPSANRPSCNSAVLTAPERSNQSPPNFRSKVTPSSSRDRGQLCGRSGPGRSIEPSTPEAHCATASA